MNGTASKKIRREVYDDLSIRNRTYSVHASKVITMTDKTGKPILDKSGKEIKLTRHFLVADPKRREYQKEKQSYLATPWLER